MWRKRRCGVAAALVLISAGGAGAQPGTVTWSVDLPDSPPFIAAPRVAPDGTIYVNAADLMAIAPDGTVKWTFPLAGTSVIDLGPTGTVYVASDQTVYALSAEGDVLWTFTNEGGQGIMAGPTVGPDGNIYAVFDEGGLGTISLTPEGKLRWNVTGFTNFDGTGYSRLPFVGDRFFFAEDYAPVCITQGAAAIDVDGNVDWCIILGDVGRPAADDAGPVFIRTWFTFLALTPDGMKLWDFTFGPPQNSFLVGPSPDEVGGMFVAQYDDVWSIGHDGEVRWTAVDVLDKRSPRAPFPVTPDGSTLIVPTGAPAGEQGIVFALATEDGSVLWETVIDGDTTGAHGAAALSPDGTTAYVPVKQFQGPARLIAIEVGGCAGDFNGDGALNILDFVAFQAAFQAGDAAADANGDGVLNVLDFVAFQSTFKKGCE
jgi:outer membrane protein assembly factor BamB